MADYSTAAIIAAKMLDCDPAQLHYEFINYLDRIDWLAKTQGGELRSRQTIAKAIIDWQSITKKKARIGRIGDYDDDSGCIQG